MVVGKKGAMMSIEDMAEKTWAFILKEGVLAVFAVTMMGVLFGWIPSVLTTILLDNQKMIKSTSILLEEHKREQSVSSSKLINISLQECVRKSMVATDFDGARGCLDSVNDTEYIQAKRLEILIDKAEKGKSK